MFICTFKIDENSGIERREGGEGLLVARGFWGGEEGVFDRH